MRVESGLLYLKHRRELVTLELGSDIPRTDLDRYTLGVGSTSEHGASAGDIVLGLGSGMGPGPREGPGGRRGGGRRGSRTRRGWRGRTVLPAHSHASGSVVLSAPEPLDSTPTGDDTASISAGLAGDAHIAQQPIQPYPNLAAMAVDEPEGILASHGHTSTEAVAVGALAALSGIGA
jgi:hypothetical protein